MNSSIFFFNYQKSKFLIMIIMIFNINHMILDGIFMWLYTLYDFEPDPHPLKVGIN